MRRLDICGKNLATFCDVHACCMIVSLAHSTTRTVADECCALAETQAVVVWSKCGLTRYKFRCSGTIDYAEIRAAIVEGRCSVDRLMAG